MYTTEKIIYFGLNCCNGSCCKLCFVQCYFISKATKVLEGYVAMPLPLSERDW
jgi:hypothetical protein